MLHILAIFHPVFAALQTDFDLCTRVCIPLPPTPIQVAQIRLNSLWLKFRRNFIPHHTLTSVATLLGLHILVKWLTNLSFPPKEVRMRRISHHSYSPNTNLVCSSLAFQNIHRVWKNDGFLRLLKGVECPGS